MKAYTYLGQGKAALLDKPEPQLQGPRDADPREHLHE